jgi:hypothetical protein
MARHQRSHVRFSDHQGANFQSTLPASAPVAALGSWRDWVNDMIKRAGTGHAMIWSAPYRTIDDIGDDTWAQRAECPCAGWVKIEWDGVSRWSPEIDLPCPRRASVARGA